MKLIIDKTEFLKSWNLAEHSAGTAGSMNIFSTIRIKAGEDVTELHATDIKTAIVCRAGGVTVAEPGEAVIPLKGVSDLFKKAGSSEFTLTVSDGRAVMTSGKSRYRFSTYPSGDFPKLPSSAAAERFCVVKARYLMRGIDRGSLGASLSDDYPQFLSCALFELASGVMKVVSTDKKRLALESCPIESEGETQETLLLPIKALRELVRMLSTMDPETEVEIKFDDSQAYFAVEGLEFAVRRVESKFPQYERILPTGHTTRVIVDRSALIAAIERVDVVVRDFNRVIRVSFTPDGESTMSGRAPEFGEAVESIDCTVEGEALVSGYNTRFFMDAVKALEGAEASLCVNSDDGHMLVRSATDDSFFCLIGTVEVPVDEPSDEGPAGEDQPDEV